MADNKRIPELPPKLTGLTNLMRLPIWDPDTDTTHYTELGNLLSSIPVDAYTWDPDITYMEDDIVVYMDEIYISQEDGNLNQAPPLYPAAWTAAVAAVGSGLKYWTAGVYSDADVYVVYENAGILNLYRLIDPARPFNSTNFATELAAVQWKAFGGGGGGLTENDLTADRTISSADATVQDDNLNIVYFNSPTPFNFTVDLLTVRTQITVINIGAGLVTLIAGAGVTLPGGTIPIATGENATIIYRIAATPDVYTGSASGGDMVLATAQTVTGKKSFQDAKFAILNPANTFEYIIRAAAIIANRNVNLPLLTADDTLVFENQIQTLINKIVNGVTLVTGGSTTKYLSENGTYTTPGAAGGGGDVGFGLGTSAWIPVGVTTAITVIGGAALTATGTLTAGAIASTNRYTQTRRAEYLETVASTSAIAGFRYTATLYLLGNAPDIGGFEYECRWGLATGMSNTTKRMFVGFTSLATAPTDVNPSTLTNFFGVGYDNAVDSNLQFYHNASSTTTKIDLGASFPIPTADNTQLYELQMSSEPNSGVVEYFLTNINTGATVSGSVNTNLPSSPVAVFGADPKSSLSKLISSNLFC